MKGINSEKCKQWPSVCLQIKTFFTFIKLKIAVPSFCIFIQFLVAGGRGTETPSYFGLQECSLSCLFNTIGIRHVVLGKAIHSPP